jgi:hypothetical protein
MTLLHRLGFFGFGLIIGIILLLFFLGGKRTSCDYSPNARVLKNIRTKDQAFSDKAYSFFQFSEIDTLAVSEFLTNANVDFGRSETKTEPCKTYFITGTLQSKKVELKIENCEDLAIIQDGLLIE